MVEEINILMARIKEQWKQFWIKEFGFGIEMEKIMIGHRVNWN